MIALSTASRPRTSLHAAFAACRAATLARVVGLDDEGLRAQPDPAFSPIGWHLGHIAYTEALWLAPGGDPHPEWARLFRQDGLPKRERRSLPPRAALEDYLATVRTRPLTQLDGLAPGPHERLWHFILQHEAQHGETIAVLRRLAGLDGARGAEPAPSGAAIGSAAMWEVPGGSLRQGHDGIEALDNEGPSRPVEIAGFRLSARPVSQRLYGTFMAAGGYRERRYWSEAGWTWRSAEEIEAPRYGCAEDDDSPVQGVSAHEAEACCRFLGARLPSESEWERAARLGFARDMLGEVWQWTSTPFAPYPGFAAFPYRGYSTPYFDGLHRVLKGGSRASQPWVLRPSFRNWYAPETRQIFAGFRYAQDL